jgi:di/tricarboxylate transporter
MDWTAWTTLLLLAVMAGTLIFTRISPDLVMLGILALLLALRILEPADALMGFANEGTVTIGLLFVVAAGLHETGAMAMLGEWLLGRPRSVAAAQVRLVIPTAVISAFTTNTPQVAVMLPLVADWARKIKVSPSKLMIPLSYATILGGLCTVIGASANMVVNGLVVSQANLPSLRLFDVAWVGVPCALVGIAYLLVFGRWGLPDRGPAVSIGDDPRQYTVEMLVEPGSRLVGQTVEQAGLRHLPGLFLVEINRADGQVLVAVGPSERLAPGDRLVFVGVVESVLDLQKIRGLKPATDQIFKLDSPRSDRCLIEVVVSDTCPLLGRTIRESRFRTLYNAVVIAVGRNGVRLPGKLGDVELHAGDALLLEAHPWFADQHRNSRDFFLVSRVENSTPPRHERAPVAVAIVLAMVLTSAAGWLSMPAAAMLAAMLMVLTGCCSGTDARRSVDWRVLVVIAASLGIGRALEVTGAARNIAHALIGLAGTNPYVALAIVYGMTMVFAEVMSHNASVVLVFPIALATAAALQVSVMPFIMAIMIAASCGFATPTGYATNLMVYAPGGYRFSDYLRFGGPLNLLMWAVTLLVAPLAWPF